MIVAQVDADGLRYCSLGQPVMLYPSLQEILLEAVTGIEYE
jgi:hypothetical protein